MTIIFYEDEAQLNKIIAHTNVRVYTKIFYKGRKIISCVAVDGKIENKCGLLSAFLNSINSKSVICEYANAVPRVWATIFNLKIISLIFGVLERKDFDFERKNRLYCLKKIQNRLYADEYVVFGSNNPTVDLSNDIKRFYKSIVRSEVRKDLPIQNHITNKKTGWSTLLSHGESWVLRRMRGFKRLFSNY
jgi:hypothetical protein